MTKHSLVNYLRLDSKVLGSMLSRLTQLKQWNTALLASLSAEDELRHHCHVVNLSNNALIVITDNPHWLTRLRYQIPDLLPKLQKCVGLEKIQAICCKVQPNYVKVKPKPRQLQPALSVSTASQVREIASKLNDKKLRAILEKIASY